MQENPNSSPDKLRPEQTQNLPAAQSAEDTSNAGGDGTQRKRISFFRGLWSFILLTILGGSIIFIFLVNAPVFRDWFIALKRPFISWNQPVQKSGKGFRNSLKSLEKRLAANQKKLERMTPTSPYLIVDTSDNLFYLMKGNTLLRKGACSTGSYTLLKTEKKKQQWIFKTPRGMFRIQNKVPNPVWRMPDWAFVEEGRPIPSADSPERYEYGVLGDYALALGDGYLIHGTLYQRFLGLAVTHGCVRVGDDDLKDIYKKLQIGSKVFIY